MVTLHAFVGDYFYFANEELSCRLAKLCHVAGFAMGINCRLIFIDLKEQNFVAILHTAVADICQHAGFLRFDLLDHLLQAFDCGIRMLRIER